MAIPLIAAGIAGVAGLASNLINKNAQKKTNQQSERFSREMYGKQRADSLSDWHMQNAYNDPSAQMQRLSSAGLNPNLVYGNGAAAQVAQSAPRAPSQSSPSYQAPKMDLGSVAFQAMQMHQLQANIARTNAETERIEADTQAMLYQNKMLTTEMFESEYQHRKGKSTFGLVGEEASAAIKKLEAETRSLMSGYDSDYSPINPNNPKPNTNLALQKIQSDIRNIAENTKGVELSNALKQYEKQIIDSLGVSGSHAGTIVSNILKLILLKR